MTPWVFPFLTWDNLPLLWMCFAPPPEPPTRWELHLRIQIPHALPIERMFIHHQSGWDTLHLPDARRYQFEIRVLRGPLLEEVWRMDTVLEGFPSEGGASDPIPWEKDKPQCPPQSPSHLYLQLHPTQKAQLLLIRPWGDTIHPIDLPAFGDTLWPLPTPFQAGSVELIPSKGRRGKGRIGTQTKLLFLLPEPDLETLLRLFFTEKAVQAWKTRPPSQRPALWDSLWTALDPNPATPVNEFEDTLYHRFMYASQNFQEGNQRGFRTDRGKIYVRYGPPAEVEVREDPITRDRLVLWYYPNEGVIAVFQQTAWGTYILLEIRPY